MRRLLWLCALVAVLVSGCGSDDPSGNPKASATPVVEKTTTSKTPAPCSNPEGGDCRGALDGGTYKTVQSRPSITYRVPDGWSNDEDTPGNFLLLPPGETLDGVNDGTSDFIGVYSSVAAPNGCRPGTAKHVGRSVSEVAAWMTANPGLVTTKPRPVSLGKYKGVVLDIRMKKNWTHTCPYSQGNAVVPLIVGVGFSHLDHNVSAGQVVRLYLLNVARRALAIEVNDLSGGTHLATYTQVAEATKFGASCPSSWDYDRCFTSTQ